MMTSIREQGGPVQKSQVSETLIGLSSKSSVNGDHKNHKDTLGSNKSGPSKTPTEALAGPPQAPALLVLQDPSTN